MTSRKLYMVFIVLIVLSLVVSACGGAGPSGASDAAGGGDADASQAASNAEPVRAEAQELTVAAQFFAGASGGEMARLDPARRGTWSFHSLLWVPLVAGDTAGNPIPEKSLAESWEANDDFTVYTFRLRPDATYSDGSPITAEDVALNWGYMAMMTHGEARGFRDNFGTGKRMYSDIVGFNEFVDTIPYDQYGTGEVGDIEGVKVIDDQTLEIHFEAPAANFIVRLAAGFAVVKPEDIWAANETEYDVLDFWTTNAAYSGQYKIVEASPGDRYVMAPNESYFGPAGNLEKITVLAVSDDPNTILTAFANQEFDMVAFPLTGDVARQAFDDPYLNSTLYEIPTWVVHQLWITPNPPLDDVHVRRAFSMAINKDAIVSILNAGAERTLFERALMHRNPAVPHCVEETAAVTALAFDPEQAKAELAQSKYGAGAADMEINIHARNAAELPQIEATAKMLEDNLGMTNISIHTEQIPNRNDPPFPIHMWFNGQQPWFADLTDTLQNMIFLMPDEPWGEGENIPFIGTSYVPELKEKITMAMASQDADERCQLVQEISQMWNDEVYSLDYGLPVAYYLIAPWVQGDFDWYLNAGQGKPLNIEEWWIAERE
ncbi:MAG: ABC transporter substrate-binding protein [Chloroflexota bacterium]